MKQQALFGVWGGELPVLEPDFDLTLGETERMGNLDPTSPRQISVVKFHILSLIKKQRIRVKYLS